MKNNKLNSSGIKRQFNIKNSFFIYSLLIFFLFSSFESLNAQIFLQVPHDGETIKLPSSEISRFLNLSMSDRRLIFNNLDSRTKIFRDREPVLTSFIWKFSDKIEEPFMVEISEDESFTELFSPLIISQNITDNNYGIVLAVNFEVGGRYFWRVKCRKVDKTVVSETFSFNVEDKAPRLMKIPNVPNARDLGGWTALEVKKLNRE